jgi:hypothetical protein
LEALFYASPWPGLVMWIVLYTSDFLMTMTCARLYQRGARERIAFEGSYEITPYYQGDVDALRMFSPRFVLAMIVTCVIQATLWFLTMRSNVLPEAYVFAVGMMVMIQLTIHVRHIRNLFLFRAVLADDQIKGRIEYGRPAMLRLSAVELLTFAGVYTFLYAITLSWFVLGGAVICAAMALNHRTLAAKHVEKTTARTHA